MAGALKKLAAFVGAKSISAILPTLAKKPELLNKAIDRIRDVGVENMRKYSDYPEQVLERKIQVNDMLVGALKAKLPHLNKNVQRKVVVDLWYNTVIKGEEIRQAYFKEHGEWPPNFIAISPTMRCNLRCVGCFASEYNRDGELTKEEVFDVVQQVKDDFGGYFITVLGGEPTIWPHLEEMVEHHSDVYFHVYTHGQNITEERAKRFAEYGNISFAISIEGDKESTDWRRGKGAYDRIMQSMDYLNDAGVLFGFSVTHTTKSHDTILSDEFNAKMVEKGASFGWVFQYIPLGRDPIMELVPTPEQRVERFRRVEELRKKYPLALFDFWNDGEVTFGCMAYGKRYMHITNKGWAEPCVFVHFAKHNVREMRLKDIVLSEEFTHARKQMPFTEDLRAPCSFIDNTEFLPDFVTRYGFQPTHQGAEGIVGVLHQPLTERAEEYLSMLAKDGDHPARIKHRDQ
ncbi:MAG: radical SAM protein [Planctomycetes bacterium]|nr:radical SAM protein [Planctomycetota bacterium]